MHTALCLLALFSVLKPCLLLIGIECTGGVEGGSDSFCQIHEQMPTEKTVFLAIQQIPLKVNIYGTTALRLAIERKERPPLVCGLYGSVHI